jgi:hypothetical protein
MCGVQVVEEREGRFEVDTDWVMPQLMGLVPDGRRLDQEVLRLDNTYFDTYFDAFNTSTSASVWADPKCSISRDPRRDFRTTWTATAPDEVRTVRTYATGIPSRTRR